MVDAYLYEIAKGYNVAWTPEPLAGGSDADGVSPANEGGKDQARDDSDDASGGVGEKVKEAVGDATSNESPKKGETGLPSVPKTSETDTKKDTAGTSPGKSATPTVVPATKKLSPEEELAARFERLKQLK